MKDFFEEIWEEVTDFFEDYAEILFHRSPKTPPKESTTITHGALVAVRPAYLFAERIDNILKVIFGISICISALTATFLGYVKLSDLLDVLITSIWGRSIMFFIGISYLLTAFWKLLHLNLDKKPTELP